MAPTPPVTRSAPTPEGRSSTSRRGFLGVAVAAGAALTVNGCASAPTGMRIDIAPRLTPLASGRRYAPYLPQSASFLDHMNRMGGGASGVGLAGIDYAPIPNEATTLICPAARGIVIGHRDAQTMSGMTVTLGHGLGWKTEYAHLEARYVGYRSGWVDRRDVIAVMGAAGLGANRGGLGPIRHLHLNLWGPAWTSLLSGVLIQEWPKSLSGFRHLVDPEELSLMGKSKSLAYSERSDVAADDRFLSVHAEAVRFTDLMLDRLDDAEARAAKARDRWETELGFDFNVDQRIWHAWHRLESGRHPFAADEAAADRANLLEFMLTAPRLTAPVVDAPRTADYRKLRTSPLATYQGRSGF